MSIYRSHIKRILDILSSFAGLIVLSPVMILVAAVLWAENGSDGVLFRQKRPGKGGKIFEILKFKTMNDRRDERGELLPDEQRLTRAGRIIRTLSLDELPQLWNVLKGDMSVVGPRPLRVSYLPLYSEFQARRHDVTPGITGWAQCHGRNAITWEHRFELDVWYVEHQSFLVDAEIVWLTIIKVLKRDGISSGSCATMEPFRGSRPE